MQLLSILTFVLPSLIVADHLPVPDHDLHHLKCDLECQHNGVCRFLTRERHDMQRLMQSGHMVTECICPMGYHGVGCEANVEDHNCDPDNKDCDCASADRISQFAGEQCRKPFTEYCASLENSVGGHISFCTNGGKCRGDLMAAQVSPGNTTSNYVFQHTGCVCPPEFIGEHCELLNKYGIHDPKLHETHVAAHNTQTTSSTTDDDEKDWTGMAIVFVCVGSFSILAVVLFRSMRHHRRIYRRPWHKTAPPPSPTELALNAYSDHDHHDHDPDAYRYRGSEGFFVGAATLPDLS